MKWVLWVVGGLILLVGIVLLIGALLPQAHVASVTRRYAVPPDQVWHTITTVEELAQWRKGLKSAQRLPDHEGRKRWQEDTDFQPLIIEVMESNAPSRLVTRIANEGIAFGGSWTFELKPVADSTELTITENGEVYNPFFRFVSRFIMGYEGEMKKYHEGLNARLAAKP